VKTAWTAGERRGPNRATNVARLPASAKTPASKTTPAKATPKASTGTDDQWESF